MADLKPAYLIIGNDRPKVEVALGRLRARFDPGAVERLVAAGKDAATGADVVAACNAGTLLLSERLVLVTEVDGRRDERGRLSGGWKAADTEVVVEYLGAPAPGTVLCLVAEELKRDSALAKACQKIGDVLVWEELKPGATASGQKVKPECCCKNGSCPHPGTRHSRLPFGHCEKGQSRPR